MHSAATAFPAGPGVSIRIGRALRRSWRVVLVVVAVLIVIRCALPFALRWSMNHALSRPGSYQGHIGDVSLSLWRGAYRLEDIDLRVRRGDGEPKPLLEIKRLDVWLDWNSLLHGRIRSSLGFDHPRLVIAPSGPRKTDVSLPPAADPGSTAAKPPVERWQDRVGALIAFRIDALTIDHGSIRYLDESRGIDITMADFHGTLRNLAGGRGDDREPATFAVTGTATGEGRIRLDGEIEPWAASPAFTLRMALEELQLPAWNASARHLDGLAFASGTFSAYAEVAARDNRIDGYIKPLFRDLRVASYGTSRDNAAKKLFWKAAIVVAENVLPNDDTDALAARIPIHGRLDAPRTDTWTVIGSILGNAFFSAILPGFEGMDRFMS